MDEKKRRVAILVAAHMGYWMPNDPMYIPVFVGAAGREMPMPNWKRDDEGNNISNKNATYCELTGHYWLWKNIDADVYGVCHYRRYFGEMLSFGNKKQRILSKEHLLKLIDAYDVIVPKKRHYWIETNYTQYAHAHHEQDLILMRQIIVERCPDYLQDWERIMRRRSGHRFNMLIMKKAQFKKYSAWLFDLLFELERRLDLSAYSAYDQRVFGFIGERLLDVWLIHEKITPYEQHVINLESQHWGKKITAFLGRKIRGYCRSL